MRFTVTKAELAQIAKLLGVIIPLMSSGTYFVYNKVLIPDLEKKINDKARERFLQPPFLDTLETHLYVRGRLHSLDWKFHKATGVPYNEVIDRVVDVYMLADSAKKFLPIIIHEAQIVRIGYFRNEYGELRYQHEDGKTYPAFRPTYGKEAGILYWVDEEGQKNY